MIGIPLSMLARRRPFKLFWATYPLLVTFVIVVTANHYWLDAAGGAAVLLTALAIQFAWSRRQADRALADALDEHPVSSTGQGASQTATT